MRVDQSQLQSRLNFGGGTLLWGLGLFFTLCQTTPGRGDDAPLAAPKPGAVTLAHVEIKGAFPEGPQMPSLFGGATENLAEAVERITKCADDNQVNGLVLEIKSPAFGLGAANELRQAVRQVRAKGKKVYAVMESAASADYLLAAACDEIIMPEPGAVMLVGLRSEVTFYKNLLDKLAIKPEVLRVGEYKSAAEPYTRTEMSPEFRREMEEILDDYYAQIVDAIAEGRKLDRQRVMQIIDSGPHTAKAAKELGLIDRLAYDDELTDIVKSGNPLKTVKVQRGYGKKKVDTDFSGFAGMVKMMNVMMGVEPASKSSGKMKIAVIYAEGAINSGKSQSDMFGGTVMGSDTIVKAIRTAADDATVKAVVLRVNSPGGSALASDLIWRAIDNVKKAKKPVVVSMGDVAASGGYYISMGADVIFAEPGTITGSIGVVGGKVALSGLYAKLGISTSVISRGKNSGTLSSLDGFTDAERQAMQRMLDDIYRQFTQKAAQGRKMDYAKLEAMARGRVYTGATALKLGLVDKLGTLNDAIAHARGLAKLSPDAKVEKLILPKPTSPFESLFGGADASAEGRTQAATSALGALESIAPDLAAHLKQARIIEMLSRERALVLMPFRMVIK